MSRITKSERLVNLFILLLNSRNFVTRQHIRETIEGYADQSDSAFERMFERDKDELRAAGVPIITGSNDPDSDEHHGYRVVRSDFELPPVEFTAEELAVLGAANSVWQDSVAAQQTSEALATLRAAGLEPDPFTHHTLRPSIASEPGLGEILMALHERREITFGYRGQTRRVRPWRLQQRGGRWFLLGHDLDRDGVRRFKLARFTSTVDVGRRAAAFPAPTQDQLAAHLDFDASDEAVTGIVAVRAGAGRDLLRDATTVDWDGALPAGYVAHEVMRTHVEALVGEVCALGADAVLLAPADLRERVVTQLRSIAEGVAL